MLEEDNYASSVSQTLKAIVVTKVA
jgi:hypothetical protein